MWMRWIALGMEDETTEVLGVRSHITIPVRPGRILRVW